MGRRSATGLARLAADGEVGRPARAVSSRGRETAASTTARVRTMNVQNRGLAGWRGGSMNQYSKKITIAASTPQITRDFKPFFIGYVLSFLGPPRSIGAGSETTVP